MVGNNIYMMNFSFEYGVFAVQLGSHQMVF